MTWINLKKKKMKKRSFAKSTSAYWLFNYIPETIKTLGGVRDNIMNSFKANTTEDYSKPLPVSNV